jgi:hypothetical protein
MADESVIKSWQGQEVLLFSSVQTGSGIHQAYYLMGAVDSFLRCEVAGI